MNTDKNLTTSHKGEHVKSYEISFKIKVIDMQLNTVFTKQAKYSALIVNVCKNGGKNKCN